MDANYNFYAELEEDCCKELEHVAFPVSEHSPAKLNISASDKSEPELTEKIDNNKDTSQVPAVPDLKLVEMKAEDEESEERRSEAGVETEIILEVLENLTLDTNTGKSPSKVTYTQSVICMTTVKNIISRMVGSVLEAQQRWELIRNMELQATVLMAKVVLGRV